MKKSLFEIAQVFTSKWEGSGNLNGGYVDHPNDKGGATKHGVSIEFLKADALKDTAFYLLIGIKLPITKDTIQNLTYDQATSIFKKKFWDFPLKLDRTALSAPLTTICTYDMCVNSGGVNATRILQRACNSFPELRPKLDEDGIIGSFTWARVNQIGEQDDKALALQQIHYRREYFHAICRSNPKQEVFLKGWLNRADDLQRFITETERDVN